MSWSVCVTWAGQERTVTPRLLSVILWWDPLLQFQVEMYTCCHYLLPLYSPLFISHFLHLFFIFHSSLLYLSTLSTSSLSVFLLKSLPLTDVMLNISSFSFVAFLVILASVLGSRLLIKTSCICIHWTMHVILFVCHYFHTHSLSTGWCLWRSYLRSDLSSFSLYLSCLSFPGRLPLSPQLQLTSLG